MHAPWAFWEGRAEKRKRGGADWVTNAVRITGTRTSQLGAVTKFRLT